MYYCEIKRNQMKLVNEKRKENNKNNNEIRNRINKKGEPVDCY